MSDKNKNAKSLAMQALNQIPTPKSNAPRITALKKNAGRVTGYQLSDGSIIDKANAISVAKKGGIAGVGIANRNGNEYLKSLPNADESTNLGNLPSVT